MGKLLFFVILSVFAAQNHVGAEDLARKRVARSPYGEDWPLPPPGLARPRYFHPSPDYYPGYYPAPPPRPRLFPRIPPPPPPPLPPQLDNNHHWHKIVYSSGEQGKDSSEENDDYNTAEAMAGGPNGGRTFTSISTGIKGNQAGFEKQSSNYADQSPTGSQTSQTGRAESQGTASDISEMQSNTVGQSSLFTSQSGANGQSSNKHVSLDSNLQPFSGSGSTSSFDDHSSDSNSPLPDINRVQPLYQNSISSSSAPGVSFNSNTPSMPSSPGIRGPNLNTQSTGKVSSNNDHSSSSIGSATEDISDQSSVSKDQLPVRPLISERPDSLDVQSSSNFDSQLKGHDTQSSNIGYLNTQSTGKVSSNNDHSSSSIGSATEDISDQSSVSKDQLPVRPLASVRLDSSEVQSSSNFDSQLKGHDTQSRNIGYDSSSTLGEGKSEKLNDQSNRWQTLSGLNSIARTQSTLFGGSSSASSAAHSTAQFSRPLGFETQSNVLKLGTQTANSGKLPFADLNNQQTNENKNSIANSNAQTGFDTSTFANSKAQSSFSFGHNSGKYTTSQLPAEAIISDSTSQSHDINPLSDIQVSKDFDASSTQQSSDRFGDNHKYLADLIPVNNKQIANGQLEIQIHDFNNRVLPTENSSARGDIPSQNLESNNFNSVSENNHHSGSSHKSLLDSNEKAATSLSSHAKSNPFGVINPDKYDIQSSDSSFLGGLSMQRSQEAPIGFEKQFPNGFDSDYQVIPVFKNGNPKNSLAVQSSSQTEEFLNDKPNLNKQSGPKNLETNATGTNIGSSTSNLHVGASKSSFERISKHNDHNYVSGTEYSNNFKNLQSKDSNLQTIELGDMSCICTPRKSNLYTANPFSQSYSKSDSAPNQQSNVFEIASSQDYGNPDQWSSKQFLDGGKPLKYGVSHISVQKNEGNLARFDLQYEGQGFDLRSDNLSDSLGQVEKPFPSSGGSNIDFASINNQGQSATPDKHVVPSQILLPPASTTSNSILQNGKDISRLEKNSGNDDEKEQGFMSYQYDDSPILEHKHEESDVTSAGNLKDSDLQGLVYGNIGKSGDVSRFRSQHFDGPSSVSEAFNLASQGLEAAGRDACPNCDGSSYALSNARSQNNDAVSVSVGK